MIVIGIMLVLIGIPSMLFLFIYTIYTIMKMRSDQKKQDEYFADTRKAAGDATYDKYGQLVMPEWFREKYPNGILGVWGMK